MCVSKTLFTLVLFLITIPFCFTVAGHLSDRDREGADSGHYSRLPVPHCQYLLAHLVLPEPLCQVATPGPALPNLLRHVRLHGYRLHRYTKKNNKSMLE